MAFQNGYQGLDSLLEQGTGRTPTITGGKIYRLTRVFASTTNAAAADQVINPVPGHKQAYLEHVQGQE